jgi:hypothetical protein
MIASIEWWSARPFTVRRAIDPRGDIVLDARERSQPS